MAPSAIPLSAYVVGAAPSKRQPFMPGVSVGSPGEFSLIRACQTHARHLSSDGADAPLALRWGPWIEYISGGCREKVRLRNTLMRALRWAVSCFLLASMPAAFSLCL